MRRLPSADSRKCCTKCDTAENEDSSRHDQSFCTHLFSDFSYSSMYEPINFNSASDRPTATDSTVSDAMAR